MFFRADSLFDELEKLGAISDDQARRSLDRLDQLDKNKPTPGQVGRYGALGAGAGATSSVAPSKEVSARLRVALPWALLSRGPSVWGEFPLSAGRSTGTPRKRP